MAKLCSACHQRRPVFARYRRDGKLHRVFRRDHDLCARCFRALRDSRRNMFEQLNRCQTAEALSLLRLA
jgi:hypothetical protein